jgi:hypothetical protein
VREPGGAVTADIASVLLLAVLLLLAVYLLGRQHGFIRGWRDAVAAYRLFVSESDAKAPPEEADHG